MNMGRLHCPKQGWWSWLIGLVIFVVLPCQSLGAFTASFENRNLLHSSTTRLTADRLKSMNMTNITGVPNAERKRLDSQYGDAGRRVMKAVSVWNGSAFANPVTNWFVYDGWNLAGELSFCHVHFSGIRSVQDWPGYQGVTHVLYTDFPDVGKIASPDAQLLTQAAIASVAKAEVAKDGISYLFQLLQSGIKTSVTDQYASEILHRTGTHSLDEALQSLRSKIEGG